MALAAEEHFAKVIEQATQQTAEILCARALDAFQSSLRSAGLVDEVARRLSESRELQQKLAEVRTTSRRQLEALSDEVVDLQKENQRLRRQLADKRRQPPEADESRVAVDKHSAFGASSSATPDEAAVTAPEAEEEEGSLVWISTSSEEGASDADAKEDAVVGELAQGGEEAEGEQGSAATVDEASPPPSADIVPRLGIPYPSTAPPAAPTNAPAYSWATRALEAATQRPSSSLVASEQSGQPSNTLASSAQTSSIDSGVGEFEALALVAEQPPPPQPPQPQPAQDAEASGSGQALWSSPLAGEKPTAPAVVAEEEQAKAATKSSGQPSGDPVVGSCQSEAAGAPQGVKAAIEAIAKGHASWWRVCLPEGVGTKAFRWQSLELRSWPDESGELVGYVPLGKIIFARGSPSSPWMQIINDGGPLQYLRSGGVGSSELLVLASDERARDAILEPVDRPNECVTSQEFLYDVAWTTLATQATESLIDGRRQHAASWWKVVVEKAMFVRPARSRSSNPCCSVHHGKIVLARKAKRTADADWLELVDPMERGHPGLYMTPKYHDSESGSQVLMEQVTSIVDVLGSPDAIEVAWTGDVSMPAGNAKPDASAMALARNIAANGLRQIHGPEQVEVRLEDTDGRSAQHRTFRVQLPKRKGEGYILRCARIRRSDLSIPGRLPNFLYERRLAAASKTFSEFGLAPVRMASGLCWHMERCVGSQLSGGKQNIIDLARHLARIHQTLPTDWFSEWRDAFRSWLPWLKNVPEASHVWWYTCNSELLARIPQDRISEWAETSEYAPQSKTGRALVTCHGDFHGGNTIATPEGSLLSVDLEYSCVTYAVEDVSYALRSICADSVRDQRIFIQHYLGALDALSEQEEELLFKDCQSQWRAKDFWDELVEGVDAAAGGPAAGAVAGPLVRSGGPGMFLVPSVPDGATLGPRWTADASAGRATWWRVAWPEGSSPSRNFFESLRLVVAPISLPLMNASLATTVVPLGSTILAAEVEGSPDWLEVFLDGFGPSFMRKSFLVSPFAADTTQKVAVLSAAIPSAGFEAVKRLLDLEDPSFQQQENKEKARYWRVVNHKYVPVRRQPKVEAEATSDLVMQGQLVLAKPVAPHWLELVLPGPRRFFMCRYNTARNPPKLLEPVTNPLEVLGEGAVVFNHHISPLHILGMPGAKHHDGDEQELVASIAVEALSSLKDKKPVDPSSVTTQDITGASRKSHKTILVTRKNERRSPSGKSTHSSASQEHEHFVLRINRKIPTQAGPCGRLHSLQHKKLIVDATLLFSEFKLAPERVNEGVGWYLEEYGGQSLYTLYNTTQLDVEVLGRFLANIHRLPTEWFDPWRSRIREAMPWTQGAEKGSYVWRFAHGAFKDRAPDALKQWASLPEFQPTSRAGRRIVTCHGSFKRQNIVRTSFGGLQVVDMDQACVTSAAEDLSSAFHFLCRSNSDANYAERLAFAKAYNMEAFGQSSKKEEDDAILDGQCWRFALRKPDYGEELADNIHQAIKYSRSGRNQPLRDELCHTLITGTLTAAGKYWKKHKERAGRSFSSAR